MNDNMLAEWQRLSEEIKTLQSLEKDLRQKIFLESFPTLEDGTDYIELGNGYRLKGVAKLNYTLDDNDKVIKMLPTLSPVASERIVNWTPKLSVKEYKLLSEEDRAKVDAVLEIKKGLPSIEIVEPKK